MTDRVGSGGDASADGNDLNTDSSAEGPPERDEDGDDTADAHGPRDFTGKYPEPREFDPVEQYGNAEEDLAPKVDIPEVENPADRLPDPSEVDREIKSAFWTAVVWMNIALAALILGPLYAFIRGGTTVGGVVTVVGILAAFRLYQTIRAFRQRKDAE